MILATTYMTGQVPFKQVYLHGLVRTEGGKKMSKSSPETIIDPMEVIPEYGTDALRFALIQGMSAGNDQRLGRSKIIANRNFCNKLWNIARYIEDAIGEDVSRAQVEPVSAADHWIIRQLTEAQTRINTDLDQYRFSEAYDRLYHFIWNDLADWYIEASKAEPNKQLLAYLLETVLILTHPFAPFVTETIWQTLKWEGDSVLAGKLQRPVISHNKGRAADFTDIQAIVTEVRFITSALKVSGVSLCYASGTFLRDNAAIIKRLGRLQDVLEAKQGKGLTLTSTKHACWLNIEQSAAQNYFTEMQAKQGQQINVIKQLRSRLDNREYVKNAPRQVVDQTREQLKEAEELLASMQTETQRFTIKPTTE
jgi:valyl-tRNA synthetase